jgi:hypothetical protein
MIRNPKRVLNQYYPKKYWYFNVNQEQKWNDVSVFPSVQDSQQLELVKQQEQQMLFIAGPRDTVLFRHQPDEGFLHYLASKGVQLPRMMSWSSFERLITEQEVEEALLVPYIVSEELLPYSSTNTPIQLLGSDYELVKRINSKFETRRLAESHGFLVTKGFFCKTVEELRSAYRYLRNQGFEKCVLKIPYGSSGKGLKVIDQEKTFDSILKFIGRRNQPFELLLEGWYPVKHNVNCQLWIDQSHPQILSITEQKIDEHGIYMGTNYTPCHEAQVLQEYSAEMIKLGCILKEMGYSGICGVDSFLGADGELYPIIEINARFTQVTYVLPIIEGIINGYKYIVSSFIRLETEGRQGFYEIHDVLEEVLSPNDANRFMVYTFATYTVPDTSKTLYRVFVILYGNDYDKVQMMLEDFQLCKGPWKNYGTNGA